MNFSTIHIECQESLMRILKDFEGTLVGALF